MPVEGRFASNSAGDIRAYMEHVFAYKKRRLRLAQWSLVTTLLLMIAGLALTARQTRNDQTKMGAETSTSMPAAQ